MWIAEKQTLTMLRWGIMVLWVVANAVAARASVSVSRLIAPFEFNAIRLRQTAEQRLYIFGTADGRRRSCLVDTGWSFTTVSTNTAFRLRTTNLISQLTLDHVNLTNVPVRVTDLRVNGQPAPYDMVLGVDFLINNNAVIDCAGRRLFLRHTSLTVEEQTSWVQTLRQAGWRVIPLKKFQPPAWGMAAKINRKEVGLLLDSGAAWSGFDSEAAAKLGLRSEPSVHQISGSLQQKQNLRVARVDAWQLGDYAMPGLNLAVFDMSALGFGPEGKILPELSGILGGPELVKYSAVIDCAANQLWIRVPR